MGIQQTTIRNRAARNPHYAARFAFSLIELLVVIAIISLLVSILLPSLQRAKGLARSAMCMTNLRNVGTDIHLFTQDRDDAIPYCQASASQWWYATLKPSMGEYDETNNPSPHGQSPPLLECPEAPLRLGGVEGFLTTYVYPRWVHLMPASATHPELLAEPLSGIPAAARRPLLVDGALRTASIDEDWGLWGTAFSHHGWDRVDHFDYRHNEALNTLFLDTHVETYPTLMPDSVWLLYANAPEE